MDEKLREYISKWLIKADHDFTIAGKELKSENPVTDGICFHCQQTAEKYLKAYLISRGNNPDKTHNIENLLTECIRFDEGFDSLKECIVLTEYGVGLRYPDDFYIPDLQEAREAFILAERIKTFVLSRLEMDNI
jgi:HEPN domain-containing protein